MARLNGRLSAFLLVAFFGITSVHASQILSYSEDEFGPVVRAYLGYLKNEQEVVDDRASRHEVSAGYYRRNSNRIKALRQMAIRLARQTHNDYLPELEAVAGERDAAPFWFEPSSTRSTESRRSATEYLPLSWAWSGPARPFTCLPGWIHTNKPSSRKSRPPFVGPKVQDTETGRRGDATSSPCHRVTPSPCRCVGPKS